MRGGFIPVPVIITQPAVDGGLGFVAQFVTFPDGNPRYATRRMLGGAYTGNGSYGYGYYQTGRAFTQRLSYAFGVGRGSLTIAAYPGGSDKPLTYTSDYDYAALGSAFWHLPDDRFYLGPLIDVRRLETGLNLPFDPELTGGDISRTLEFAALGFGLHFDSRDNPVTPTRGLNAYLNAKYYRSAFGSDRDFDLYDLAGYYFHPIGNRWQAGLMTSLGIADGNLPFYFAPAVTLRGAVTNRFQGQRALSTEGQIQFQIDPRWSVLAFAGCGETQAGDLHLFSNSGPIYTGGTGFRYLIARKLGIKAGLDVATGPDGTIYYVQFGSAWSQGMD